jgi:hypothetical protein
MIREIEKERYKISAGITEYGRLISIYRPSDCWIQLKKGVVSSHKHIRVSEAGLVPGNEKKNTNNEESTIF